MSGLVVGSAGSLFLWPVAAKTTGFSFISTVSALRRCFLKASQRTVEASLVSFISISLSQRSSVVYHIPQICLRNSSLNALWQLAPLPRRPPWNGIQRAFIPFWFSVSPGQHQHFMLGALVLNGPLQSLLGAIVVYARAKNSPKA